MNEGKEIINSDFCPPAVVIALVIAGGILAWKAIDAFVRVASERGIEIEFNGLKVKVPTPV